MRGVCETQDWTTSIDIAAATAASDRDKLIASVLPMVVRVAVKVFGRGKVSDDVLQEGALALVRKAPLFDPARAKFTTFAWCCLSSHFSQLVAKQRTASRNGGVAPQSLVEFDLADYHCDIAAMEDHESTRRQVRRALRSMQPADRLAVELYYFEGLSHRQIAAQIGVCKERVRQRLNRALKRARQALSRPARRKQVAA